MAEARSYRTRAIVLRKTKLGEKDVIASLLAEDGSIIRAVAKGARKPGGSLAAKLELFSTVEVYLAKGKNLDVITEARFDAAHELEFAGLEQSSCASIIAELLSRLAQEGLEQPRLFDAARACFDSIKAAEAPACLALCAASVLKLMALSGFRPHFESCLSCGREVELSSGNQFRFSHLEGGVLCDSCPLASDALVLDGALLAWARALLMLPLEEVAASELDESECFALLHFARQWVRVHVGHDLKSFDFIFSAGLF